MSVIAGDGVYRLQGDNGPAVDASLARPTAIALAPFLFWDDMFRLIIADTDNHRVREINLKTGAIETIAGKGMAPQLGGFNGDGLAVNAELNKPMGVYGNLLFVYIADIYNHCIRVVNRGLIFNSNIITVVGSGIKGYNGDQLNAASTALRYHQGLYLDSHFNIVFVDTGNHLVRKSLLLESVVLNFAGTPNVKGYSGDVINSKQAKLSNPASVFVDTSCNDDIYVADSGNKVIRKLVNNPPPIMWFRTGVYENCDNACNRQQRECRAVASPDSDANFWNIVDSAVHALTGSDVGSYDSECNSIRASNSKLRPKHAE